MQATKILKLIVDNEGLVDFKFSKTNESTTFSSDFFEETYHFKNEGENLVLVCSLGELSEVSAYYILKDIIEGNVEIIPAPFIPKEGDTYWGFDSNWQGVSQDVWENCSFEVAMFAQGMIFKTEKEALDALHSDKFAKYRC